MKKRTMKILAAAAGLTLSLSLFAACGTQTPQDTLSYDSGVVRAFRAVTPSGELISQTAVADGQNYLVTVITSTSVSEYSVDAEFNIESTNKIVGEAPALTALAQTEEGAPAFSDLERAFEQALALSGLSKAEVEGFDFDKTVYMGKQVFKVEIEDAKAEYSYIFAAEDLTLLASETELKYAAPSEQGSSYIGEERAKAIALEAAGLDEASAEAFTLKCVPENGRRLYIANFNNGGFRYTVEIDALNGDIVKFSQSILDESVSYPDVPQIISEEEAKQIALGFAFPDGTGAESAQFRKVKLDYEKGRFVYEVEFVAGGKEYEMDISASDGTILDVEIDEAEAAPPQSAEFITREQAIRIVRDLLGDENAFILDVEIEVRKTAGEKRYYYEIEVKANGRELEFYVDALTGDVTSNDDYTGNPADPTTTLTEEEVLQIALTEFQLTESDLTSKKIHLEMEDGALLYEIKLVVGTTEYKLAVDAHSGTIVEKEIDIDHDTHIPSSPSESGYITQSQAVQAVKDYFAGQGKTATVDETDVEWEDRGTGAERSFYYEVEAYVDGREYDCYVDAVTGAVRVKGELMESGKDLIGEERALAIALEKFSLSKSEVRKIEVKLDEEDGRLIYEVEFKVNSMEYSFEIDAVTGAILEYDRSFDD